MDAFKESDLHEAVENREVEKVRFLLEQGVYVNATNAYGKTPLHRAYRGSNVQVREILLEYGADLSDCVSKTTPLQSAARSGKENIVKLRLKNGADVNEVNRYGDTPLHYAARGTEPNIITLLVEKGADVNAVNSAGETPLHAAVRWIFDKGHAKLLIEYGVDINARNIRGRTPLHTAVEKLKAKTVSVLLSVGADVNAKTRKGATALDLALHEGRHRSSGKALELICHHIVSLQVAGLYVSKQNIRDIGSIRYGFWCSSLVRELDLHELECEKELERLKTKLESGLSLKYVLTTNDPRYLRNEVSAQQLDSINYTDFPIYGNLLKRKLETDKKELLLLEEAMKAFGALLARDKRTTQLVIPSELSEKILCYLSNCSLQNLILGAGIN